MAFINCSNLDKINIYWFHIFMALLRDTFVKKYT